MDSKAGVVKKKRKKKKDVLLCTRSLITAESTDCKHADESDRKQDKQTSAEGHVFGAAIPRLLSCLCPLLVKRHSCMCVSAGREMKQVITPLITWRLEGIATKETCFKRGDVRQTGEQVAGSQRGRVRRRQTDGETGSGAGRQRDIVVLRDRQTGGLAVVSISDNNSSNVIIGSLIKINLISATHNTFCLLKRSLPLWHLSRGERREEVRVDGWTGTIAFLRLSCTAGVCFVRHPHKCNFCNEKVFLTVIVFFGAAVSKRWCCCFRSHILAEDIHAS